MTASVPENKRPATPKNAAPKTTVATELTPLCGFYSLLAMAMEAYAEKRREKADSLR